MTDADINRPPPTAPPTIPGQVQRTPEASVGKLAPAAAICGIAGLLLPLVNLVGIGLGIVALVRSSRHALGGRPFAIIGICAGAIGILLNALIGVMIFGMTTTVSTMRMVVAGPVPDAIHEQSLARAAERGAYPTHVAELMLEPHDIAVADLVVSGWAAARPGSVMVGEYDLANFDNTAAARVALRKALAAVDVSEPWYRFGDCWFVRLDFPRQSPNLVAGWTIDTGFVRVVFDDGSDAAVALSGWAELWADDAEERRALGLPALESVPPLATDEESEEAGDEVGDEAGDKVGDEARDKIRDESGDNEGGPPPDEGS